MNENSPSFNHLLERMMEKTPIRDSYRLTLWANFFNLPIYAYVERKFGLLRDEYNILECLVNYGLLTASNICLLTGRPRNTVGRGVDKLIRRGMITRRADKADRRRMILKIEPSGRRAYEEILPLFVERERLMLGQLNQRDRKALQRILDHLMASPQEWANEF